MVARGRGGVQEFTFDLFLQFHVFHGCPLFGIPLRRGMTIERVMAIVNDVLATLGMKDRISSALHACFHGSSTLKGTDPILGVTDDSMDTKIEWKVGEVVQAITTVEAMPKCHHIICITNLRFWPAATLLDDVPLYDRFMHLTRPQGSFVLNRPLCGRSGRAVENSFA